MEHTDRLPIMPATSAEAILSASTSASPSDDDDSSDDSHQIPRSCVWSADVSALQSDAEILHRQGEMKWNDDSLLALAQVSAYIFDEAPEQHLFIKHYFADDYTPLMQRFYRAIVAMQGPYAPRPAAKSTYQRWTGETSIEFRKKQRAVRLGKLTGDNDEPPHLAAWEAVVIKTAGWRDATSKRKHEEEKLHGPRPRSARSSSSASVTSSKSGGAESKRSGAESKSKENRVRSVDKQLSGEHMAAQKKLGADKALHVVSSTPGAVGSAALASAVTEGVGPEYVSRKRPKGDAEVAQVGSTSAQSASYDISGRTLQITPSAAPQAMQLDDDDTPIALSSMNELADAASRASPASSSSSSAAAAPPSSSLASPSSRIGRPPGAKNRVETPKSDKQSILVREALDVARVEAECRAQVELRRVELEHELGKRKLELEAVRQEEQLKQAAASLEVQKLLLTIISQNMSKKQTPPMSRSSSALVSTSQKSSPSKSQG